MIRVFRFLERARQNSPTRWPLGSTRRGRRAAKPPAGMWRKRPTLEPLECRLVLDSTVVFNEIMYNVPGSDDGMEWIELYNQMGVDIDLSGWSIADGARYTFPDGTILEGGEYLVVASDPAALRASAGVQDAIGPFDGGLANGGETVRLRNHADRIMDELDYDDRDPWPTGPDGSGASLAKIRPDDATASPEHWRSSDQVGGTPGSRNFPEDPTADQRIDSLIAGKAPATVLVPTAGDAILGTTWTALDFDSSGWTQGSLGVGFDTDAPPGETSGLLRYYPWDSGAEDLSGNGVLGRIIGPAFSPDVPPNVASAQSLQFDGVKDRVNIIDEPDPVDYTLSAWVKPAQVRESSIVVRLGAGGTSGILSHQLRLNDAGHFEHQVFDNIQFHTVTGTTVVQPGQWYHVAGTARSDGTIRLFVNGVEEGSPSEIGTVWGEGRRWLVGSNFGPGTSYFDGWIDELAIWSGALSAAQIQNLAQGTAAIDVTGYTGQTGTDVRGTMFGNTASAWSRAEFNVVPGTMYDQLTMDVLFDDGFVAYLNGVKVAEENAPEVLSWDAAATSLRPDAIVLAGHTIDLSQHVDLLRSGRNVLALHGLNIDANDSDFLSNARLEGRVARPARETLPIVINEIAAVGDGPFWIELMNTGSADVDLEGMVLTSTEGNAREYVVSAPTILPAGDYLVVDQATLGFDVAQSERALLYAPGKKAVLDSVRVLDRPQARLPDGRGIFQTPEPATPGDANRFAIPSEIVINEIMYHHRPQYAVPGDSPETSVPFAVSDQEWVELFNRSDNVAVDLSGWQLDDAVRFTFPDGTVLPPGQFLVIAKSPAELEGVFSDIFAAGDVLGPFAGKLSNSDERLVLLDDTGNVADEVHYYDGGRWPGYADGGGVSLELRDPRADNAVAESWAASDEAFALGRSEWQHYEYTATVESTQFDPAIHFHELVLGLLDAGEVLLDNVQVIEEPAGSAIDRMQNGTFDEDAAGTTPDTWRIQGTHFRSQVVPDPRDGSNQALHLVAEATLTELSNHAETTLEGGAQVAVGTTYRIAFDALWVAGSPQLHTELHYRDAARTTIIDRAEQSGTPGATNSTFVANAGPVFDGFRHGPVVPRSGDEVTVSVAAHDPDGIDSVTLMYAVDGAAPFTAVSMAVDADGMYSAVIPPQSNTTVVQFYVQAQDQLGAVATFPAAGPDSRALYKVFDGFERDAMRHNIQMIMTPDDIAELHDVVNMMDNQMRGTTVVYNGEEVFYDVGTRLKGSMFTRDGIPNTGYQIRFHSEQRFRGVHKTVGLDQRNEREILIKHIIQSAGLPGAMYDDVVILETPTSIGGGPTLLSMARHTNVYLESQFVNGGDGTVFKLSGIRVPTATHDGTPEGFKLYRPIGGAGMDLQDMGDDKELYRWPYVIKNNREKDDYSHIIDMAKVFSLEGEALREAADEVLDVDEWLRVFAMLSLGGITDVYSYGGAHNLKFYVRPEDNKVLAIPWDWDFSFNRSTEAPLRGDANTAKLIDLPGVYRVYLGHLWNLIQTSFNMDHMAYWTDHYEAMLSAQGSTYQGYLNTIGSRGDFVLGQLPAQIPFEITWGRLRESESTVVVEGRGWIDVREVRPAGIADPLDVHWLDDERWRISVPLQPGDNAIALEAYDHQGALVGDDSIGVTAFTRLGDLTGDGLLDAADIDAMVLALRNPVAYESGYGLPAAAGGDADQDGDMDFDDIDELLALVAAASSASASEADIAPSSERRPLASTYAAGHHAPAAPKRIAKMRDDVWAEERDWVSRRSPIDANESPAGNRR